MSDVEKIVLVALVLGITYGRGIRLWFKTRRWQRVEAECVEVTPPCRTIAPWFLADIFNKSGLWTFEYEGRVVRTGSLSASGWDLASREVGDKAHIWVNPKKFRKSVFPEHIYSTVAFCIIGTITLIPILILNLLR